MTILKYRDIQKMNNKDIEGKLKDLKMELIKKNVTANKSSKVKAKEIKKAIARLLTKLNSTKLNTEQGGKK